MLQRQTQCSFANFENRRETGDSFVKTGDGKIGVLKIRQGGKIEDNASNKPGSGMLPLAVNNGTEGIIEQSQNKEQYAVNRNPTHVEVITGDKQKHIAEAVWQKPERQQYSRKKEQIREAAKEHRLLHQFGQMIAVQGQHYLDKYSGLYR